VGRPWSEKPFSVSWGSKVGFFKVVEEEPDDEADSEVILDVDLSKE
jgi:hypothetical protein